MDKRISCIGLVLLVVGIILIVSFWPIFGENANDIKKSDGKYKGYDVGNEVTVHGTITEIKENDFPGLLEKFGVNDNVLFELGGNIWILVNNESSIDFQEGEEVYCEVTLNKDESISGSFEYWVLGSNEEIRLKDRLDYIFYFIAGIGTAISSAGFIKD